MHGKLAPHTSASFCLHHDPGDYFQNLKASFNSSAQTGYDATAFTVFQFGRHYGGYLCGTNGTEATAAILVQRDNEP